MKNFLLFFIIVILLGGGFFYLSRQGQDLQQNDLNGEVVSELNQEMEQDSDVNDQLVGLANPASVYCEENNGQLELITNADGSQFALCRIDDYACEEWAYYNGNCNIEADLNLIKEALIAKGLSLEEMKVVIKTHLGTDIEASVVPVSVPAGGGYVFATKVAEEMKIVADGNGAIMCSMLAEYPDFSTYLIPICYDETTGLEVTR